MTDAGKKKGKRGKAASGGQAARMVRLSLAVASLMPLAEVANAQLAVNCAQDLQFGPFSTCGGGGSIKITPVNGNATTGGCIILMGTPKQAKCSVKSFSTTGSLKIQVTTTQTDVKGAGTMKLDNFNIATAGGGATKTYTSAMLTATPLKFGVGGLLDVANGQAEGAYSGKVLIKVFFTP